MSECRNENCPNGGVLPEKRKLKDYCTYACRGQFRASEVLHQRNSYVGSKNTKQIRALQTLKRRYAGHFTFAKINACTYRIDGRNKRGVSDG